MADNNYDPAGNTQMFRAFVDEGAGAGDSRGGSSSGRTGLVVAVAVIAVALVAAVVWLAIS